MGNKKAVATTEAGGVPAQYDYGQYAGAGFETTTNADLAIPFINLMQPGSPAVEEGNFKLGDMVNSVTGEFWSMDKGFVFQPCHIDHKFVEWKPRNAGGGMVAQHEPGSEFVKRVLTHNGKTFGKLVVPGSDNELIETQYVYGNLMSDDGKEISGFAVIAFNSTKLTPLRKWRTAMFMLKGKPPLFAFRAKFTAVKEKNDANQTYANFAITPFGADWRQSLIIPDDAGKALLKQGSDLRDMILSGAARAATETLDNTGDGAATSSGGAASSIDKDVPF